MEFGADVCDPFSEAPGLRQGFYSQKHRVFQDWWESKGKLPIPEGCVILIMRVFHWSYGESSVAK